MTTERRRAIVAELVSRPGHERVRTLVYELLVNELGATSEHIHFERRLPEVHGRADALLGRTVFEFKRDLRAEKADAEEELSRYIRDRQANTGDHFVGIATDGAVFAPYELRGNNLRPLREFRPNREKPEELLVWLDSAVSIQPQLAPEPETVRRELGRDSLVYEVASARLADLWREVSARPDVQVKRKLWAALLEKVYGSSVDASSLFFQHTYLTIVAKTMATRVLGVELPAPTELLAGQPFQDAGISGAVESDFFDWLLTAPTGAEVVQKVARQVARFRLEDVKHDVLKGLYESLIDPEQRHELGEYYTPDWLATKICTRVIDNPLEQRVLDPACGSGTFLFHAVRRFFDAADTAGLSNREAVTRCARQVLGIDVHPVAVLIARVTYLLALGEERLRDRPPLSIPVYLGDSLQWSTQAILTEREVRIDVPDGPALYFPFVITRDPHIFDAVVERMLALSEHGAEPEALAGWLAREQIGTEQDRLRLVETYAHLRQLRVEGRNHIWGYVARNLSRPIWLSTPEQHVDAVIGNPPWLSFRYMAPTMQNDFRNESQRLGVWAGGRGRVSHQDLSGYFFARAVELYLRPRGTIAFVMPYAVLSRHHFEFFRTGKFASTRRADRHHLFASVRFVEAWAFDENVHPLFQVPSCVLVATEGPSGPLPPSTRAYSGELPKRDATAAEADTVLVSRDIPWPRFGTGVAGSPYREVFRNGAIVYPRMFFIVEAAEAGRFGGDPTAPLVKSRRSVQEKRPWKNLPGLQGRVEVGFLRPLYLGESVAPYRALPSVLAVVPWDDANGRLLDERAAEQEGSMHVARWLRQVEALWQAHGRANEPIVPRLDYFGQLRAQMPPAAVRVVYAKSGSLPAAFVLRDRTAIIENRAYWAAVPEQEAHYLVAILNSEVARQRVAHLQSRGQWGARDFDKVIFELVIPTFASSDPLHQALAQAGADAERVAMNVEIPEGTRFVRARKLIRDALIAGGVAERVERLVGQLLGHTATADATPGQRTRVRRTP